MLKNYILIAIVRVANTASIDPTAMVSGDSDEYFIVYF